MFIEFLAELNPPKKMKNERGARLPSNCHKQLTSSQWSCGWQLKLKQNNFWTVCGRTGLLENSRISWEGFAFTRPLSLLHLVQAGVLDKHVLEKSISSPVWNKLIRGGLYEEDAVQVMDVTNLVDILKLLKEPGALLLPLLEAICEKFPSVQDNWGNRNEVLIRCPNHAEPHTHRVSIHGFLLLEDVEAAFGTRKQMIESLSVDTLGEPLLSAAGSRMSRQQEQISSLSIFQEISLENKQSAQAFDTPLQASQVKITYLLQLRETLGGRCCQGQCSSHHFKWAGHLLTEMLCCVSLPQNIVWPRDEGKTSRPFGTPWTGESGFTNLLEKMNSHCMFWNQALERGGSWRGFWISLLKNSMLHFWSSGALTLDHPWAILFFPIHTIFQNDAIYRDIFLALNWSQMCVISFKICFRSAYVEIFAVCFWENNEM